MDVRRVSIQLENYIWRLDRKVSPREDAGGQGE